jgi:hypothetical protein
MYPGHAESNLTSTSGILDQKLTLESSRWDAIIPIGRYLSSVLIVSAVISGLGGTFLQSVTTAHWLTAHTQFATSGKLHHVMPDVIHAMSSKPAAGIGPACSVHVLHMREGVVSLVRQKASCIRERIRYNPRLC